MKILYLSCHSILEYDELKLFNELGLDVFSHGAYMRFNKPSEMRPAICAENNTDEKLLLQAANCTKENLSQEFIDNFDVIIVMHIPTWIINNWSKIKDKIVVWRTIGQSTSDVEGALAPYRKEGLKIVRYSENERSLPNYIGEDAVIRFYKDGNELNGWNGDNKQIITIAQSMVSREAFCNYDLFNRATDGFQRSIFGPNNEEAGEMDGGVKGYDDLKKELRNNRVYFYTGTHPASYTLNFIEAFMTGIPIVAIGPIHGNMQTRPDCANLYEIPSLITNYENGFYSDDIQELRNFIQTLMDDKSYAKEIGQNGRRKAISLFEKVRIKAEWKAFLERLI
jgi:hypothetical protein